jgi:hypothetical protein
MSTQLVRTKFQAIAAKIETVPGTDAIAGTPAATDWLGAGCEMSFDPTIIEIPENNGSLDETARVVGGLKPTITLSVPLRGSGVAATAPEWGKLMQGCTFDLRATATAIGAPTAATAGTTTTVTGAVAFAATDQIYRGMPLSLTGDQTDITGIVNYTAARVFTVGDLRTAMTTSTFLQIPANNLYLPTSDEAAYKSLTFYVYADGELFIYTGGMGTVSIALKAGEPGRLTFTMRATLQSRTLVAVPPGAAVAAQGRPSPPRWVDGRCRLNRVQVQASDVNINAGVNVVLPDDPEAAQGFGPGVPLSRQARGTLNPYVNTTTVAGLFAAFQAGTQMPFMARVGSVAGNRFIFIAPLAKQTGFDPTGGDGLMRNNVEIDFDGADIPFFVCAY